MVLVKFALVATKSVAKRLQKDGFVAAGVVSSHVGLHAAPGSSKSDVK